jgi:ABC-2 type transport system permease protein
MKILATIKKEWILLWRDKIGLVILFLLPMCLVLFISLTSTDHGNDKPANKLTVMVLDRDHHAVGTGYKKALEKVSWFHTLTMPNQPNALAEVEQSVRDHTYSVALVIPARTTEKMNAYLQAKLLHPKAKLKAPPSIQLLVDSGMQGQVQNSVSATIALITSQLETAAVSAMLGQTMHQPRVTIEPSFIDVNTDYVSLTDGGKPANSVQYNVPAWTLFGMFFIVIPLAGVMVRERELGVHQRLEIAPVWHLNLMLGRIIAFMGLNLIQLWLMLAVGVFILPLFDMPVLTISHHVGLIFATGICASLAATGFGLLIGTWASTYEQATVLGPFVIVIAAAIGGIMAPIDLMPHFLQTLSSYSPLNWAQTAFVDIFARNADLRQILPELSKLVGFFVLMVGLSLIKLVRIR